MASGPGDRLAVMLREAGVPAPPMIAFRDRVASTNEMAKAVALAEPGAPWAGSVFLAGEQTAGRGRYGRVWVSPPGGLYMSVLVVLSPGAASLLPIAAGLAAARAVEAVSGCRPDLRWPNDLDWRGGKLAGSLAEGGFASERPDLAVVGFGINLAPVPEPPPGEGLGRPPAWLPPGVDRVELAASVVAGFRECERLAGTDPKRLVAGWEAASPTGRSARCRARMAGGEVVCGETRGLAPDGGLRVLARDGGMRVVHANEIELLDHDLAGGGAGALEDGATGDRRASGA